MHTDLFIKGAFANSTKADSTNRTYCKWINALCQYVQTPHPLDITIEQITRFYVYLHDERQLSRASLEIVRAALLYFYTRLLVTDAPEPYRVDSAFAQQVTRLFAGRRSYAHTLPGYVDQEQIDRFLAELPDTNAGHVLRRLYDTGKPVKVVLAEIAPLTVSVSYLQQLTAKLARRVGIVQGFGLRGLRVAGILNRIRTRRNDNELIVIQQDAGIKSQQFLKYVRLERIRV